jgi:hypothetical protein
VVASNVNGKFEFGAVHESVTDAFPSTPDTFVTTSAASAIETETPKANVDDNNAKQERRASWRARKSLEILFRIRFGTPYKIGK